ncbi:DUF1003 domain-containing protein [Sphingobium sp. LMA1-1-1.1]
MAEGKPAARVADLAQRLLEGGLSELSVREQRVISTIVDRHHVTRSVNRAVDDDQTIGDHIADRVARFGGSWTFIIIFVVALVAWVGLNTLVLIYFGPALDPYPFIFLNLILSMIAALQAPIILMSQNRQAARDRISAGLDYEINLKAELEIMALHEKLDALRIDRLEMLLRSQGELLEQLVQFRPMERAPVVS